MPRPRRSRPVDDDDIDAITPCPLTPSHEQEESPSPRSGTPLATSLPPSPVHPMHPAHHSHNDHDLRLAAGSTRSTSPMSSECGDDVCGMSMSMSTSSSNNRRRDSVKALEEGTDGDPERLWRRMLALQQIYGCYNSARMSAALSSGDASLLLPSKACLDLLNEHMSLLPDEAERALGDWRFKAQGPAFHV